MIESAEEFVRLRMSEDPVEYHRAAWESASEETWRTVISEYPDMRKWVAHNKKIPESIIRELYALEDEDVKSVLARKRKTPVDILEKLASNHSESIRNGVVFHPKITKDILLTLINDPWENIRETAIRRLSDLS